MIPEHAQQNRFDNIGIFTLRPEKQSLRTGRRLGTRRGQQGAYGGIPGIDIAGSPCGQSQFFGSQKRKEAGLEQQRGGAGAAGLEQSTP